MARSVESLRWAIALIASISSSALPSAVRAESSISEIIDATGDGTTQLWAPGAIAVAPSGDVYVASSGSGSVFRIATDGAVTEVIGADGDGAGNPLDRPSGVAVDGSGSVYVAGSFSDNAFELTGGTVTEIIDGSGDGAGNPLSRPSDIAVDGAGNVYVAGGDSSNAFRVTPGGAITQLIDGDGDGTGNELLIASAVAVDGAGDVYVAGQNSNNVFKIEPGGAITEIIDGSGDGAGHPLERPLGLAVDGGDNVYVTGATSDNVLRITPAGVITEVADAAGDGANPLDSPQDVAVTATGDVLVTGRLSHGAFKVTPGGLVTEIIDANGDGAGAPLEAPRGVAAGPAGLAYVSGSNSFNVFRIPTEFHVSTKKVLVKNPNAGQGQAVEEPARYVLAMAKEGRGHHVTGDPTVEGATLRIVVNGTVPSDETYTLAASGWRRVGPDGFRFRSSGTAPQPNPIGRVSIRRTGGSFELKAILAGNRGSDELDVLPASATAAPPLVQGDLDDLGLSLQLGASGATYCFRIGGAAGGVVRRDHAREARVVSTAASPSNTTLGCP